MSDVEIKDDSKQAIAEMKAAMLTGLEACGMQAETYAKRETPVDTGRLKNSITHKVVSSEPAYDLRKSNRTRKESFST